MLKIRHLFFIFSILIIISCNDYQKLLKSGSAKEKYEAALIFYDNKDYGRAIPLLEELIPIYRGTAKSEKSYYLYIKSNYYTGDYYLAANYAKKFAKNFPSSIYTEECLFLSGYISYILSSPANLDQTDSKAGIEGLQHFINLYPNSNLVDSSNTLIDKLTAKLEHKALENAKHYYKIYHYKASIIALENVLEEYPLTKQKEEILMLLLKSNYHLSINSVEKKKIERFNNTIETYYRYVDQFPDSKNIKEAENLYKKVVAKKQNLL